MRTPKTIAGIQFTESGIVLERRYAGDDSVFAPVDEKLYTGDYLRQAKRLAKIRMANCYKKLHTNMAAATHIKRDVIAWKGGHFSVPVWEALEGILKLEDVRNLTALQAQQLIRAIMLDQSGSTWLYDYDKDYNKIPNSDIQLTEGFKVFITEQIFVVER
jgi:hypothetical protein